MRRRQPERRSRLRLVVVGGPSGSGLDKPLALQTLARDLGVKDVVDFVPNYDNQFMQPSVLPAAYPNLLVNGTTGIAVGMATNMAPHNLREVVAGARAEGGNVTPAAEYNVHADPEAAAVLLGVLVTRPGEAPVPTPMPQIAVTPPARMMVAALTPKEGTGTVFAPQEKEGDDKADSGNGSKARNFCD